MVACLRPLTLRLSSADGDQKPNAEESAVGGAAAEPSTSQPQKTEEPCENGSEQPEPSQVKKNPLHELPAGLVQSWS